MSDDEIAALAERVKCGGVWWNDGDNLCRRVRTINLRWVEFADEPDNAEPAALLHDGKAVALYNTSAAAFVTMRPALDDAVGDEEMDNLTLLQNAARSGLDVNFMTGSVSLPRALQPQDAQ